MESVKEQLQVLNQEAASLSAEVKQAWARYMGASEQDKPAQLDKHGQLVAEKVALDKRRSTLEQLLAGTTTTTSGMPSAGMASGSAADAEVARYLWFTAHNRYVRVPVKGDQVQMAGFEELFPWFPPKAYKIYGAYVGPSSVPGWGLFDWAAVGDEGTSRGRAITVERAAGALQAVTSLIPAYRPTHHKTE